MLARHRFAIALYALVAATAAVLIEPLLALAYFATSDGAQQLDIATVSAWAEPARERLGGLVTWSSADRVYATYTQVMALMFPAVVLTALVTRTQRSPVEKRSERIGWRIALTGYGLFAAGTLTFGVSVISLDTSGSLDDVAFLAMMLPGMLLSMIGSTVLGIRFLRSGYRPRLAAWLLTFSLPLLIVGSAVLGHNGFGIVPLMIAWAAIGWHRRPARTERNSSLVGGSHRGDAMVAMEPDAPRPG